MAAKKKAAPKKVEVKKAPAKIVHSEFELQVLDQVKLLQK